jgi:N-acetylmuramoyl-L-alanine amidase
MRARAFGRFGSVWGRLGGALAAGLCLIVAAPSHGAPTGSGVLSVRLGGDRQETRIVVELGHSAKGRVIIDGAAGREVVLGLSDVSVSGDLEGAGHGLVTAWKVEGGAMGTRLHLQLARAAQVRRRFLLPPADGVSVYRYVIDIAATDATPPFTPGAAATGLRPALQAVSNTGARPIVAAHETILHLKKVVVIDAGHGGKDPGAKGANHWEKDINLAAARALKARLERTGRYRVVMTRDSDAYVPLETRVQIARRADADLFISLHSDSGPDATVRGASVYTLSDKGSDRTTRNVMAANDWFIHVDMPGRDRSVNQILLDLTQRATRNRSAAFAENLLGHITDETDLLRRSHRDAGFVVLLAPDVPAVLLEMGFITNGQDEGRLADATKRDRFMNSVADSIDSYFGQQTRVASR